MLQIKRLGALVIGRRHCLGGIALAMAASGCGQHFDLGEIRRALDEDPPNAEDARAFELTPLMTGVEDLDVRVENVTSPGGALGRPTPLGDVDGDGFGDWFALDTLYYGGPRPQGDTLDPTERARFVIGPCEWFDVVAAGDVNGDGIADILLSGCGTPVWTAAYPPDVDPELSPIQGPAALLILGSRERLTGDVGASVGSIAFGDRDQLADRFAAERARNEPGSSAFQKTSLRALGDLDGDGLSDFSVTTSYVFSTQHPDSKWPGQSITDAVVAAVTYVHYGAPDIAAVATPAARLDAQVELWPLGDLDGNGAREVLLSTAEQYLVLPGPPARLHGDITLAQALPIYGIQPDGFGTTRPMHADVGDFDADGYADLLLGQFDDSDASHEFETNHLFYGGPGLLDGPLSVADAAATFVAPNALFMRSFSPLGDFNGDGYPDLLVDDFVWPADGDIMHDLASVRRAALLRGTAARFAGTYTVPTRSAQVKPYDSYPDLAKLFIPAGDLDGDGYDDLFATFGYDERGVYGIKYGHPVSSAPAIR
jgi:hypothetical protein